MTRPLLKLPARHKPKLSGLKYALRVLDALRRPADDSGEWNTALDAVASDVLGDIQMISAAARKAAGRRVARMGRRMKRFKVRRAPVALERPPRWVMTPCLASEHGHVIPRDGLALNWCVERITGLTLGADGEVPGHTGHTVEFYETLEAAVEACGGPMLPITILKAVAGKPLPSGATVTARLVPSIDILTTDKWWVLRVDIGWDGQAHHHEDRAVGPYPLKEAMAVAWGIAEHPNALVPPPCPCADSSASKATRE